MMPNILPEVLIKASDPNKDFTESEKEYIRRPDKIDKDLARDEVMRYRLSKPRENTYFHPIKGVGQRWSASISNNTNPLIGLNKTVGKALSGAQVITTLPYILTRGISLIPKLKNVLAPARQALSKNYLAGVNYGNIADVGQIIENPKDPVNYIEAATGRLTGKLASSGLGTGSKKWLGSSLLDGIMNVSNINN